MPTALGMQDRRDEGDTHEVPTHQKTGSEAQNTAFWTKSCCERTSSSSSREVDDEEYSLDQEINSRNAQMLSCEFDSSSVWQLKVENFATS